MYKVNGELSSCDITYSGRVQSREGDITQLCIITSLKWIIQICSNFYCWVCKIVFLLTQSTLLFGGNFPFNWQIGWLPWVAFRKIRVKY